MIYANPQPNSEGGTTPSDIYSNFNPHQHPKIRRDARPMDRRRTCRQILGHQHGIRHDETIAALPLRRHLPMRLGRSPKVSPSMTMFSSPIKRSTCSALSRDTAARISGPASVELPGPTAHLPSAPDLATPKPHSRVLTPPRNRRPVELRRLSLEQSPFRLTESAGHSRRRVRFVSRRSSSHYSQELSSSRRPAVR
jgi:hypothetical protein